MSANPIDAVPPSAEGGFSFPARGRAIAAIVERILRIARCTFRGPAPAWHVLNDHLLADIGVTHAEAEAEAARRLWHAPLGTMADGVVSQDWAKPLLRSSRFD
jgi:hypothetical protein